MAQRTNFSAMACSLARSWAVIGEPWTPLILRDLSLGLARFDEIQADLGISRNVLADRLRTLSAAGIVARRQYESVNRKRDEYVLTDIGKELVPVIVAIIQWGDRWLDDGSGPPVKFRHSCGAPLQADITCRSCGESLAAGTVSARLGPGARRGPGTYDMLEFVGGE